jgi:hypothetical protein
VGLLVERHKLVNQEMITGNALSEVQQQELALLNDKIKRTLVDKARLESKVESGSARENDQKKLIGIFKLLHGNAK